MPQRRKENHSQNKKETNSLARVAQNKKTHQKIRAAPMTEWTIKDVSETLEDISDDESGACIDDTPEDE